MADDITINIVDNPVNVTIGLSTTPDNFQVSTFPSVAIWGNIIGTLSAQTDLWTYLSAETFSPSQLTAFLNSNAIDLCSTNIKGQLLSAGTDLFDIFLTSETDSQTLSYTPSSYLLSISNGNTVDLSSINSLFGNVSGKYEEAYNNITTNSAAYLSSVDLSFLSVSGNWNQTYTLVQSNSSNWGISNNVDGGSSTSVYLLNQNINGGSSNTF